MIHEEKPINLFCPEKASSPVIHEGLVIEEIMIADIQDARGILVVAPLPGGRVDHENAVRVLDRIGKDEPQVRVLANECLASVVG